MATTLGTAGGTRLGQIGTRCRGHHIDEARAGRETRRVTEWVFFIHPPRENFAATMTDEEKAVWAKHFARLQGLLADGQLILAGPTLGQTNTGIAVFEAADEEAAEKFMAEDPVIAGGFARGELRPFRLSLLRGRD
jgi:uncharacterized protein YciI